LFRDFLPLTLLAFSIGAIIPFIIIGLLAGSISKLTRSAYRHRLKIRAISGLILIGYALYLLYYILPRLLF
jgi:cytochrome c biogenesis protein CcdA